MNTADRTEHSQPMVSVIIPVYNEPEGIRITLESVLDQTYPKADYEVIAVDNDSNDGTESVIRAYRNCYPETVRLVVEDETQGPAAARNAGIREACGTLFAFIDADMTVEETWLESVVVAMTEGDWDYMGCEVDTYSESDNETLLGKYSTVFGAGSRMEKNIAESRFAGTGCLTVTSQLIDEMGVFDERLSSSEDLEFGRRVYDAGFDQHFEPDITVYHPTRESFSEVLRKSFKTGKGLMRLHLLHPDRSEERSLLNPRNYLPPHPRRMHERITNELAPPADELVALYALSYLNKLANSTGKIYECVAGESVQPSADSSEV